MLIKAKVLHFLLWEILNSAIGSINTGTFCGQSEKGACADRKCSLCTHYPQDMLYCMSVTLAVRWQFRQQWQWGPHTGRASIWNKDTWKMLENSMGKIALILLSGMYHFWSAHVWTSPSVMVVCPLPVSTAKNRSVPRDTVPCVFDSISQVLHVFVNRRIF